jgi:predicted DCC family thiol-disulfide oxidoreductase YuxK
MDTPHPIILYDGVCGLCNRLIQFILKRDKLGVFHFAALQSEFARDILIRHSASPDDLDTLYIVLNHGSPDERLLSEATAALHVLRVIGGAWRALTVFGIFPTSLLNIGYRFIANNRYRLFGQHDQCLLPEPEWKQRFIATE